MSKIGDKIKCSFYCPPMGIGRISGRLRRTHAEPMRFETEDGAVIEDVTIPPTDVTPVPAPWWALWRRKTKWQVAACEAAKLVDGLYVKVELPIEPVDINLIRLEAVAAEMRDCPTTFLRGGETWVGNDTVFPECHVPLGGVAESVTATGTLTRVS